MCFSITALDCLLCPICMHVTVWRDCVCVCVCVITSSTASVGLFCLQDRIINVGVGGVTTLFVLVSPLSPVITSKCPAGTSLG